MTLWEFAACMDGVNEFHGGKKPSGGGEMSDDRLSELGIIGFEEGS